MIGGLRWSTVPGPAAELIADDPPSLGQWELWRQPAVVVQELKPVDDAGNAQLDGGGLIGTVIVGLFASRSGEHRLCELKKDRRVVRGQFLERDGLRGNGLCALNGETGPKRSI